MNSLLKEYHLQLGITVLLGCLLALFALLSPQTFLNGRIYLSFLSTIPFVAILALGLTLLVVAGELDLSFPSVMAMSGFAFVESYLHTGSPWFGFALALATGGLAGLINGLIVVKVGVPSIIATIGTQFFWRGMSALLAAGLARNIAVLRDSSFHHFFVGRLDGIIPVQAFWCLGFAILFSLLLNRHVMGGNILFVGDNIRAARLNGINTDRVRLLLFVMMGLVSAFVAVLISLEMGNWWPTQGEGYLLLVFAAIFIGGTSVYGGRGTLYGTLIGAVIIGIIEAGIISAGYSGFWTRVIHGFIIVASVSIYALIFRTRR